MTIPPVVILVGGLGTRLSNIQGHKPKALVEVLGKPFLSWKIAELQNQGVPKIYLLTGFRGSQIYDFVEQSDFDIPIALISDGPKQKGTAAALKAALPLINSNRFILTYGDNLLPLNVHDFLPSTEGSSMLVTTSYLGPGEKFNSQIENGYVVKYSKEFDEKFNGIDYGYSVLSKADVDFALRDSAETDLAFIFSLLATDGKLRSFQTSSPYFEIGTPAGLEATESWLKGYL